MWGSILAFLWGDKKGVILVAGCVLFSAVVFYISVLRDDVRELEGSVRALTRENLELAARLERDRKFKEELRAYCEEEVEGVRRAGGADKGKAEADLKQVVDKYNRDIKALRASCGGKNEVVMDNDTVYFDFMGLWKR